MEISMTENKKTPSDVIVNISGEDKDSKFPLSDSPKDQKSKISADSPRTTLNDSSCTTQKHVPVSCPSPEIVGFSQNPNKPPKTPTNERLTQRKSFSRRASPNSKVENTTTTINTPEEVIRTVSLTPKTPLMSSSGGVIVDEDEEIYKKVNSRRKLKYRTVKKKVLIKWIMFLCVLGFLIASLTVDKVRPWRVGGLRIWKWCVLVLVTFSGMLVTKWLIRFIVLLIELNYLLKKKVLYFVYGLKKSVQVCIWLSLVLATWVLLFHEGVEGSHSVTRILHFISWTIASLLIGAFLWLLKTLLLKILASSFHVNTFFDRIQDAIFHQYILQTLSGPPVMESAQVLGRSGSNASQLSLNTRKKGKEDKKKEKEVIDINKLHQMKQEKVTAWTMKRLVDGISSSGLTTLSSAIDESVYGGNEQADTEITNEEEAIAAAYHIFRNVAQPGCKYIDEMDLWRFMIKEQVDLVFPMIDVANTGQIDMKTLTDWMVKVYKARKALAHALNDAKTAVEELNRLVSGILIVILIILWLLLTGIATTKVLVFLSSQLVVVAFMFGNTCKTIFEALIFVFVMHPFDVGDRCVIDGVQMIVEEMNILTTVFLKSDNEKIYYPNSVLATKPISNFYRSPDMGDSLEFSIDFKTPVEKIGALKENIKKYLEKNSRQWHPNHNVVVKEIENVNKIKMALFFNHTMNFQDFSEKNRRRTELVLEMKKFFEELNIGYDLLPQQVHLVESGPMKTGTTG
ncbi:Mechanosensitive ion channel protein 10 [Abeliophyllum distichum]|uniref:Mechanosensitive ion channel protein n=1 Tax=Abeliophyllum distichum TaxID=126358 RepID=A0ABD1UL19_9LAMI